MGSQSPGEVHWLNDIYTLPYPIPEIEGISWKKKKVEQC
jgi:hypothetical protein